MGGKQACGKENLTADRVKLDPSIFKFMVLGGGGVSTSLGMGSGRTQSKGLFCQVSGSEMPSSSAQEVKLGVGQSCQSPSVSLWIQLCNEKSSPSLSVHPCESGQIGVEESGFKLPKALQCLRNQFFPGQFLSSHVISFPNTVCLTSIEG